ncbi:hypothetical protein QTH97_23885 [Variovorax sp. J22R24]|uniref:hypothetical protein n=1 Tax=Variovorax gracilis TaxID=3053502 RepID=UPI0025784517|nr:hypothetical protein [Variovorax sp. J22R24]MDM0108010.1 hypothetical protein [Variovorax sp. J22R24]
MITRTLMVATATGIAALAALGLFLRQPQPDPASHASPSDFATRFQPVLDGIGSTRDLAPVPLGDVAPTDRVGAAGTGSEKHREPGQHPR